MRMPKVVWFCAAETCDAQEPWTHTFLTKCQTCNSIENVTRAVKFGNLEGKND